ncbi:MAG: hypothetical protein AAGF88_10995 [Pseudomonadota bacterium]
MAIDISEKYKRSLKFPNYPELHARIKLRKFVERRRERKRAALRSASPTRSLAHPCKITDALEAAGPHFREHGWAFMEGVFDPAFHELLVKNWPDRAFFVSPKSILKGYDYGFQWVDGQPKDLANGDLHPEIQSMRDTMDSAEMAARVKAMTGWEHDLHCNSTLATYSYPGTCVVPHRDTVVEKSGYASANFIFFINGSGGERSGGLVLSRDNELKDRIFEPSHLVNSCLVYDTSAPFFHGFEPIQRGKFRWMMSAHFAAPDQKQA